MEQSEFGKHYGHTSNNWRKVHKKQWKLLWAHLSRACFLLSGEEGLPPEFFCLEEDEQFFWTLVAVYREVGSIIKERGEHKF